MKFLSIALAAFALATSTLANATDAIVVSPTAPAGTLGNPPFTLGWRFAPTTNINLTRLGLFDQNNDGFADSHDVGVWDSSGALISSVTFASGVSGTLSNRFRYLGVGSTALTAGQTYYIGALYRTGSDQVFFPGTPGFAADPTVGFGAATFASGSNLTRPTGDFGTAGFFGPTLSFSGAVPEPATWAMMILGFGVIGGAMRSRRRQTVRFATA